MSQDPRNRRQSIRRQMEKPCKLYEPRFLRFTPGTTVNVSSGGALVDIQTGRPYQAGDEVDLVIALTPVGLVARDSMVNARVVRATDVRERTQRIALQFAVPMGQVYQAA